MTSAWSGTVFRWAWRYAHRIPEPVLNQIGDLAADAAWLRRGKGIRQLERNLARVRPDLDQRMLRRLSRAGMRSYVRYYCEAFILAHLTRENIAARVRPVGDQGARDLLAAGKSIVLALGHLGNWDLAGAWAGQQLGHVTTVAERLEPDELYQEFLEFRSGLGMTILTFGDPDVFAGLRAAARKSSQIIPLLADRDLGRSGVEVDLFGSRARVAAGPATLAVGGAVVLYPLSIHYERLSGQRRRDAGSRWGIVVTFHDPVPTDDLTGTTRQRVSVATQRWIDALANAISAHPQDWHMLQKVFVEDLDQARDAAIVREGT